MFGQWRIQREMGDAPHRHPQYTETGHFEVQNLKKTFSGEGYPLPTSHPLARLRPHPPPTISGSATAFGYLI